MLKSLFAAALGMVLLASPKVARAAAPACLLRLETPLPNWLVDGHDVFDAEPAVGAFELVVVNDGAEECRTSLRVSTDAELFGLTSDRVARVGYSLVDRSTGFEVVSPGARTSTRGGPARLVVPAHAQLIVTLDLRTAADFPSDGLFIQQLQFELDGLDGAPLASRAVQLAVRVRPSVSMTLSGAFTRVGGVADVDLGTLATGAASLPLGLRVRSSRGFRLTSASANGGLLRSADGAWSIPYRLTADAQSIDGNGGSFVVSSPGQRRVRDVRIGFTIGDIEGRRAGHYADVIILTLAIE